MFCYFIIIFFFFYCPVIYTLIELQVCGNNQVVIEMVWTKQYN